SSRWLHYSQLRVASPAFPGQYLAIPGRPARLLLLPPVLCSGFLLVQFLALYVGLAHLRHIRHELIVRGGKWSGVTRATYKRQSFSPHHFQWVRPAAALLRSTGAIP